MNRLKTVCSYIYGMNLAYLLILGLIVKALVSDISYATFLLTVPVLGFESYKLYLKHKTPDPVLINAEVLAELNQIKAKLNAGTLEKNMNPTAIAKRYF